MSAEKKVNYTAQPFSPNDKPHDFESFDPKRDVRNVGNRWLYPSDSESDTYFQINKLPTGVWGDYSEDIEGKIARTGRMYERPFNSSNRSEIAHEEWQIVGTAAIGGIIGAIPGITTHYLCHKFHIDNQLAELLSHVFTIGGIIGGTQVADEILLSSHDNHSSSETQDLLTQARNQGKKTQVEVIEWRERTNDPKAVELETQLDSMIRSYENAYELTQVSMEQAPWWKSSVSSMIGGFVGVVPGALTYAIGRQFVNEEQEKGLRFVSGAIATTGMIAGTHAVTEIMRPKHVNTTSKDTAEELFNARNMVRKNYADAIELRRAYHQEDTASVNPDVETSAASPAQMEQKAKAEQLTTPSHKAESLVAPLGSLPSDKARDSISTAELEQYRQKAQDNIPTPKVTSIEKQTPLVEINAEPKHSMSV